MGFEWWTSEQRVRINLSQRASIVINSDMLQFQVKDRSSFLNTVFSNYYQQAQASVSLYLQEKEHQLHSQLENRLKSSAELTRCVNALIEAERTTCIQTIKSQLKEKFEGNSYRINNENLEYLTGEDCNEAEYYNNKVGAYLKCLMEEYASLSFLERERIFYADLYNLVSDAIETHSLLKVKTFTDITLYIYPHSLEADSLSTRLYLTGYSESISDPKDKRPASFRLPRLKSIKKLKQSGKLSAAETTALEKAIKERTIQFLLGDEEEIHVRFTETGIRLYYNQLYLRPPISSYNKEKQLYIFHCTPVQAEYYFFKFANEAEILSPLYLRERFADLYSQATTLYQ